jgi:hypothetical protein
VLPSMVAKYMHTMLRQTRLKRYYCDSYHKTQIISSHARHGVRPDAKTKIITCPRQAIEKFETERADLPLAGVSIHSNNSPP